MDPFEGNLNRLTQAWGQVAAAHAALHPNLCWDSKVASVNMDQTEEGYWRLRWTEPKLDSEGGHVYARRKVEKDRWSMTKVYTKKSFYLHHLAVYLGNPPSVLSAGGVQGLDKRGWDMSHLCGNASCYSPRHLVHEPHQINLDRIGCTAGVCGHFPRCLVTEERKNEKTATLYQRFNLLREE